MADTNIKPTFTLPRKQFTNNLYHPLYLNFDSDTVDRLLMQDRCELDYEFPGFVEIYETLSNIIPLEYTVIDLGCYMATQCWYFRHHQRYIGVDRVELERFQVNNTCHYLMSIDEFIKRHGQEFNPATTFAISCYVGYEAMAYTKYFPNCYTFYPSRKLNGLELPEYLQKYIQEHNSILRELHESDN